MQTDSSLDSTLRTVNVEKTKDGIGLSIKVIYIFCINNHIYQGVFLLEELFLDIKYL